MSDHFLQLADMVVQRGGVAHVVPDHDVGATVIVADIGFEVARRMQQQILGDQLAGPWHPVGFRPAPTRLLVGLGHHIGQRQAPVEYLLLGDEGLDVREALQVGRVAKGPLGVRLEGDVEDLDAGQVLLHPACVLHQRPLRTKESERFVGDMQVRRLLHERSAKHCGQGQRPERQAAAKHAERLRGHCGEPPGGCERGQPALVRAERGIKHR